MRRWIALVIAVVTLNELRVAECRVACGYIGYDGGSFWKTNCYCYDIKDYFEITNHKRIVLPKKSIGKPFVAPLAPETYRGYPKELDDYLF